MTEVLFWTMAVFAVLSGPALLAVWWELRRERKEADQRERQRRLEEAGRQRIRGSHEPLGPPPSTGAWSGMLVTPWILVL